MIMKLRIRKICKRATVMRRVPKRRATILSSAALHLNNAMTPYFFIGSSVSMVSLGERYVLAFSDT